MTKRIHSNDNYTGVGIIEVLNEPVQDTSITSTMISDYYPTAYKTVRDAEDGAGVGVASRLHVQMMVRSSQMSAVDYPMWLTFV